MKWLELMSAARDGNPPPQGADAFPDVQRPPESAMRDLAATKHRIVNPSRIDLSEVAGSLRNSLKTRELGNALMAVYRGLPFAEPGERDTVLWSLVSRLAKAWPDADVEAVCRLFAKSAETMEAESSVEIPILDALRAKWDRAAGDIHSLRRAERDFDRARRQEAWRLIGEDRDDELPLTAERLVAYHGSSHFVRVGHAWHGPVKRDWFTPATLRTLGALYGTRWDSFADLIGDHGVACGRLSYALGQQHTQVDPGREIFVAGAPVRPGLVARRSAACERLIATLGGQYAGHLTWWLAGLMRTDTPCRALVISGAKHTGKSLLLAGLGGLWTDGAASMRHVLGKRFNGAMADSWLAIADDDEVAKTEGGETLASFVRAAVSDRLQSVERKHHEVAKMRGCMRYAFATNDAFAMISSAVSYSLNPESLSAFGDRILHIPVSSSAQFWWQRERVDPSTVVDEMPGHVLWLHENLGRAGTPQERFWVGEADPDLAKFAVVCTGLRGDILLRISQEINHAGPAFYERTVAQMGARMGHWLVPNPHAPHESVLVSPIGLHQAWGEDKPRGFSARAVGQACVAFGSVSTIPYVGPAGNTNRVQVRAMDSSMLNWFADRCGL